MWLLVIIMLLFNFGGAAVAQLSHIGEHQRSFYIDKLPSPSLMEGLGRSNLRITSTSALAQEYFNQGLSLLHDFWEFEAYRAFKEAARQDSMAAMAYWGIYMAEAGPDKIQKAALEKAKALSSSVTEHEQFYIRSISLKDSLGGEEGTKAYRRELEALITRYPDDAEAQLFLSLSLMTFSYEPDDYPSEGHLYSQNILTNLLDTHPDHHGVHHYWIHVMESQRPEAALASAEKLASLAPKSGHIVHMPGHIYNRMGNYEKARKQFIKSMRVDSSYMAKQNIAPVDTWNYIHNLHYLIANCAEEGRYQEGLQWANRLKSLSIDSSRFEAYGVRTLFYQGLLAPARLELRFGFWDRAVERFIETPEDDSLYGRTAILYRNGLLAFAEGMNAIQKRDVDEAKAKSDALDALLWRATKEEKNFSKGREKLLTVASLELRGNIHRARGEYEQAITLLRKAVEKEKTLSYGEPPRYIRPALESLAETYLEAGHWDKAIQAYEQVLEARPNSGYALFGIAKSYDSAGDKTNAFAAYERFLKAWRNADADLSQIKLARSRFAEIGK